MCNIGDDFVRAQEPTINSYSIMSALASGFWHAISWLGTTAAYASMLNYNCHCQHWLFGVVSGSPPHHSPNEVSSIIMFIIAIILVFLLCLRNINCPRTLGVGIYKNGRHIALFPGDLFIHGLQTYSFRRFVSVCLCVCVFLG